MNTVIETHYNRSFALDHCVLGSRPLVAPAAPAVVRPPPCSLSRGSCVWPPGGVCKENEHSSSSSLFLAVKLVPEPGQVNLLWVVF